jgi:hypothetical protein
MRILATALCLVVLCASANAQTWNLAQDKNAALISRTVVHYEAIETSTGIDVLLARKDNISDEVAIWRTSTGSVSYTIADARVFDPVLSLLSPESAVEVQGRAAVLTGLAHGHQKPTSTGLATTDVWYSLTGVAQSMRFEIRWSSTGEVSVARVPTLEGGILK